MRHFIGFYGYPKEAEGLVSNGRYQMALDNIGRDKRLTPEEKRKFKAAIAATACVDFAVLARSRGTPISLKVDMRLDALGWAETALSLGMDIDTSHLRTLLRRDIARLPPGVTTPFYGINHHHLLR